MGLDWNPGPKPKPGFEQEYRELFEKIKAPPEPSDNAASFSLFGGILRAFGIRQGRAGSPTRASKDALVARLKEISTTAFETLETPQVGFHPAADEWARKRFAQQSANMSMQRWMKRLKGCYVLDAVPPCDGLPRYTNGETGGYVEAYSFRAKFLRDCEDIIGEELFADAYQSKLSDALVEFGRALLDKAERYAEDKGIDLEAIDVERLIADAQAKAQESAGDGADERLGADVMAMDEFRLDIVRAAGRWCVFWGERGHLMEAYW